MHDNAGFERPASLKDLLDTLPDHLSELIVLLDEDGLILWFNRTAEAVLGWPRAHWIGQNITRVLHPDDVSLATELLVSARATGSGIKEPACYRIATAYADWLSIEAVASTVELMSGRTVLVMSARTAGRARRPEYIAGEVEERLSMVFEHAVIPMALVGLDGRILQLNRSFGERIEAAVDRLHGVSFVGLFSPFDRAGVTAALSKCADGAGSLRVPATLATERRPETLHLTLVPDWLGEPLYVFAQVVSPPGPTI